jgi:hypothetical protein
MHPICTEWVITIRSGEVWKRNVRGNDGTTLVPGLHIQPSSDHMFRGEYQCTMDPHARLGWLSAGRGRLTDSSEPYTELRLHRLAASSCFPSSAFSRQD